LSRNIEGENGARQVGRAGVVRVSQLRARRLPAMDSNGRADPFVLMRTGEGMAQRVGAATRRRALKASLRELEADGEAWLLPCHASRARHRTSPARPRARAPARAPCWAGL
jgi:hypothetical protein